MWNWALSILWYPRSTQSGWQCVQFDHDSSKHPELPCISWLIFTVLWWCQASLPFSLHVSCEYLSILEDWLRTWSWLPWSGGAFSLLLSSEIYNFFQCWGAIPIFFAFIWCITTLFSSEILAFISIFWSFITLYHHCCSLLWSKSVSQG